jgi:hypothetical protein
MCYVTECYLFCVMCYVTECYVLCDSLVSTIPFCARGVQVCKSVCMCDAHAYNVCLHM